LGWREDRLLQTGAQDPSPGCQGPVKTKCEYNCELKKRQKIIKKTKTIKIFYVSALLFVRFYDEFGKDRKVVFLLPI